MNETTKVPEGCSEGRFKISETFGGKKKNGVTEATRVLVVGGGFGGLHVAQTLRKSRMHVTMVDRRNFHLFQPLLYQVATGSLSPANISTPLRTLFKRHRNVQVYLGEVTDIDVANKKVILTGGELGYDVLVLATGAMPHYFGHDAWAQAATGLKTIEDATNIRGQIFLAFEAAEREPDPAQVKALLTFVIVGGGPTGVELAGAVREIANHTLRCEFRHINPPDARIIILDRGREVLDAFPDDLSDKAAAMLKRLNVTLRNGVTVTDVAPGEVTIEYDTKREKIAANTIIWAAGVKPSPLGAVLCGKLGIATDHGRVPVNDDLTVSDRKDIFVIGDLAALKDEKGNYLPGVAQVAIQQGNFVAKELMGRLRGAPKGKFKYRDLGSLATIGRAKAVADIGGYHFAGTFAWLLWLFVHLMKLVQFEDRILVFITWSWNFFTRNRSACLITGSHPAPARGKAEGVEEKEKAAVPAI